MFQTFLGKNEQGVRKLHRSAKWKREKYERMIKNQERWPWSGKRRMFRKTIKQFVFCDTFSLLMQKKKSKVTATDTGDLTLGFKLKSKFKCHFKLHHPLIRWGFAIPSLHLSLPLHCLVNLKSQSYLYFSADWFFSLQFHMLVICSSWITLAVPLWVIELSSAGLGEDDSGEEWGDHRGGLQRRTGIHFHPEREQRNKSVWESVRRQACRAVWWDNESVISWQDNIIKQQSGNWILRGRGGALTSERMGAKQWWWSVLFIQCDRERWEKKRGMKASDQTEQNGQGSDRAF